MKDRTFFAVIAVFTAIMRSSDDFIHERSILDDANKFHVCVNNN